MSKLSNFIFNAANLIYFHLFLITLIKYTILVIPKFNITTYFIVLNKYLKYKYFT